MSKIIRVGLPLAVLAAFYGGLAWFSLLKARTYAQPRPALTAAQSRAILSRSERLLADGNYREALGPAIVLFEAYPENPIYIDKVAQIYERLGDFELAAQFREKYMDYAPLPDSACPQVGDDYWKQGEAEHAEAISAYERCLKLDPSNPDFIFYLAHALEMSGDFNRAALLYQQGLKISPQYPDLQLGLARVMVQQGHYDQAQQIAQDILSKSPENVDALLVMGLNELKQGHLDQAKKYLNEGASLSPGYTDFHLELARIAEEQKDYSDALQQYSEVLKLEPNNDAVRARVEKLEKESQR